MNYILLTHIIILLLTTQSTPSPTTAQPTNAPTTAQPTNTPTTAQPTPAPTNEVRHFFPFSRCYFFHTYLLTHIHTYILIPLITQPTPAPTTAQPTNTPTTAQPTNQPLGFYVAGGSSVNVYAGVVQEADPSELHKVRCCVDDSLRSGVTALGTSGLGWNQHANCAAAGFDTWGESDPAGVCNPSKTHAEAVEICSAAGARLCSKEELLADCAQGTGKYKVTDTVSFDTN